MLLKAKKVFFIDPYSQLMQDFELKWVSVGQVLRDKLGLGLAHEPFIENPYLISDVD